MTIMDAIIENQRKDGMTIHERNFLNTKVREQALVTSSFHWGFLLECEKQNINPTIFRYKKYLERRDKELQDFRKNFIENRKEEGWTEYLEKNY